MQSNGFAILSHVFCLERVCGQQSGSLVQKKQKCSHIWRSIVMLKHLPRPLGLNYLNKLIKLVLRDLTIPQIWKVARIASIFKPNKQADVGTSYPPTSLLSRDQLCKPQTLWRYPIRRVIKTRKSLSHFISLLRLHQYTMATCCEVNKCKRGN